MTARRGSQRKELEEEGEEGEFVAGNSAAAAVEKLPIPSIARITEQKAKIGFLRIIIVRCCGEKKTKMVTATKS